jgi:diaminohydroxyphosphoribosylaminopyrimidine deaminase / 5-amino-6-(5-phosphoribosylamino)uracil reductase
MKYPNNLRKDIFFMKKALAIAKKGAGLVTPNPLVGAFVVKEGKVIGKGYHKQAGGPHAEVFALDDAGPSANGSTLYVSLEPCCHYGKTPPCTKKIIECKVKRVVIASIDPFPQVKGRGIKELELAGIEVTCGILEDEAIRLNEFFFKFTRTGFPFVTIKGAVTADGKTATSTGKSKWISNEVSRNYTHKMRFIHDSILVGVNTVLHDDPLLTCRLPGKKSKKLTKIIVDSTGKTPVSSKLFDQSIKQNNDPEKESGGIQKKIKLDSIIIASTSKIDKTKKAALESKGAEVVILPGQNGKVDLKELLHLLGNRGITSVLVEGGSEINASLIEHNLADKLILFIAPKIAGGRLSPTIVGGQGYDSINDCNPLIFSHAKRFKDDIMLVYYFSKFKYKKDQ